MERSEIERRVQEYIAPVRSDAEAFPDASRRIADTSILRPTLPAILASPEVKGNVRAQVNAALDALLRNDSLVLMVGEDLHEPEGCALQVTQGRAAKEADCVISTPSGGRRGYGPMHSPQGRRFWGEFTPRADGSVDSIALADGERGDRVKAAGAEAGATAALKPSDAVGVRP